MSRLALLDGLRVVDLAADTGRPTGRILADLGATVFTLAAAPEAPPARSASAWAWRAFWDHRKERVSLSNLDGLTDIDLVIADHRTPHDLHDRYPDATWVWVTPFGRTGPRASWRGSELTCIAASGNLYPTGYPDRPPVACSRPTSVIQGAAEAAIGALFALAAHTGDAVDVSVQEATIGANLGAHTTLYSAAMRGERNGPFAGGAREVWPCADGHVSFAIRGGPARASNWVALRTLLNELGADTEALPRGDARSFDPVVAPHGEIDAITEVVGAFFERHTKSALATWARERGIMMAPVVGPAEIVTHPQLHHRKLFDSDAPWPGFAGRPVLVHEPPDAAEPRPTAHDWSHRATGAGIWSGLRIVEFGSAFAGPLVSRYFAEHGATCIHIESSRQPDSARLVGTTPVDPSLPRLERSPLFPAINANKLSVTLDLKTAAGRALAERITLEWADVLVENFSPRVLDGWGLGYERVAEQRPDIVYASSTMWGHDGPFANEKGFGGIGQALSGHVFLTGYPDREPVFPFGLITDSLTPKLTATAVTAALLRRRRTGRGCHVDVSQIEAATYTLGSWLLEHTVTGESPGRSGNDFAPGALVHGVFPCRGTDQWIALAVWNDDELVALADELGSTADIPAETAKRDADELAQALQHRGVDAAPVLDLVEVCSDPQVVDRGHFVDAEHPVHGTLVLERCGFRIGNRALEPLAAGPVLGHDTHEVLSGVLGCTPLEIDELERAGVLC